MVLVGGLTCLMQHLALGWKRGVRCIGCITALLPGLPQQARALGWCVHCIAALLPGLAQQSAGSPVPRRAASVSELAFAQPTVPQCCCVSA